MKLPMILDVRDDLILHGKSMGLELSRKALITMELDLIENFDRVDKILVPSDSYREYYNRKYDGLYSSKMITVINATDINHFRENYDKVENGSFNVGFIGGLNKNTGIDLLLDACILAKKQIPTLKVKIAYNTIPATEKYANEILSKYKHKFISFYDNISYKNAPEFFSRLSLFVIPMKEDRHNHMSTPSKLFDSMGSGLPVIVTNLQEQARIVENEEIGVVTDFNVANIADNLIMLHQKPKKLDKFRKNARKTAVQKHNWDERVKIIIDELTKR